MAIYVLEKSDNITQTQICDALHFPKSIVHSILSYLIKQQYVTLKLGSNKKLKFIIPTVAGKIFFLNDFQGDQSI